MSFIPHLITAIATPLCADDTLHEEGLEILINEQLQAGIDGLLIGGTMGAMQLLTDETYCRLIHRSIALARGRGELLAGAGDLSFARTWQRMQFLNTLPLDGIAVLPPFFLPYDAEELFDYYHALADESRLPLYLYDVPQVTKVKLEMETVLKLAKHPNIRGIKCSDEPSYARQLIDLAGEHFRVIMAAPLMLDVFLRQGVTEHVDGIFCLCPHRIVAIARAAVQQDWEQATAIQQGVNGAMRLLRKYGLWRSFTALMNALGTPGLMKPRPHRQWSAAQTQAFLEVEETQTVLQFLRREDEESQPVLLGTDRAAVYSTITTE